GAGAGEGAGAAFGGLVRTAREALSQARALAGGQRDVVAMGGAGGGAEISRLALPILICVHVIYVGWLIASQPLRPSGLAGAELAVFASLVAAILGLQVMHTVLRPKLAGTAGAYATLAVQAALTGAAMAVRAPLVAVTLGFLLGSLLLLVRARWSVPLTVLLLVAATCHVAFAAGVRGWDLETFVMITVHLTLVVYGLTTLNEMARRLQDAHAAASAMAVLAERQRFARDVHDLYGLTLSAIILKGELVCRIVDREPRRARTQIVEIVELAEAALGELRSGAGDSGLSLAAESRAARRLLSAVGVQVRGRTPRAPAETATASGMDAAVDAALAVVLREAVANVLRHSAARRVTLEIGRTGDRFRLRVANDGVPATVPGPPGNGIANLTARVLAVGGTLSAAPSGGGFELVAEVPADGSREAAGSQPAGLRRDPDGVETVAGAELGHDRRKDVADRPT
ncbi:MAG: sensor histidine kinase, partial [Spirillospora sp.]